MKVTTGLSDLYQRLSAMKGTAKLSIWSDNLPFKLKEERYTVIELIGQG